MEENILFSQDDISRAQEISAISGLNKALESDEMYELYDNDIAQRTDNNIRVLTPEQRKQLRQVEWDKSYELNHTTTGAYWFDERKTREEYRNKYPNELTPLEANEISKELGFDLKYDKPTNEGEVRYALSQQAKRKALSSELAQIRSLGADYDWWENVGLALNGTYSWREAAVDLGVGVATGFGIGLIGKTAQTAGRSFMITKNIANISKMAAEAAEIEHGIMSAKNTAALAESLAKGGAYSKKVKDLSFMDKVGYDWMRMTKPSSPILSGGKLSTSVAFGLDAAVGNIPTGLARSINLKDIGEEGSVKNFFVEELCAFTLGAGLPFVGRGIRSLSKGGKILNNMSKQVEEAASALEFIELSKGHAAAAKEAEQAATNIKKETEVVNSIANADSQDGTMYFAKTVENIDNQNVTDSEFLNNIEYIRQCANQGIVPDLNSLPNKTSFMSSIKRMYSTVREAEADNLGNPEMFQKIIKETGAQLGIDGAGLFEDGKLVRVAFIGEKGALGDRLIPGLTADQAGNLLMDMYRFTLLGDKKAGDRIAESANKMGRVKDALTKLKNKEIDNKEAADLIFDSIYSFEQFPEQKIKDILTVAMTDVYRKGHPTISDADLQQLKVYTRLKENLTEKLADLDLDKSIDQLEEAIADVVELTDTENRYMQSLGDPVAYINKLEGKGGGLPDKYGIEGRFKEVTSYKKLSEYTNTFEAAENRVINNRVIYEEAMSKFTPEGIKFFDNAIQASEKDVESGTRNMSTLYEQSRKLVEGVDNFLSKSTDEMRQGLLKQIQQIEVLKNLAAFKPQSKKTNVTKLRSRAIKIENAVEIRDALQKALEESVIKPLVKEFPFLEKDMSLISGTKSFCRNVAEELAEDTELFDRIFMPKMQAKFGKAVEEAGVNSVLDDFTSVLFTGITKTLLNAQADAYLNMSVATDIFRKMIEAPRYASETLLGRISYTPFFLEGGAGSVEDMSQDFTNNIMRQVIDAINRMNPEAALGANTPSVTGRDALEYAKNKENTVNIISAVRAILSSLEGSMSFDNFPGEDLRKAFSDVGKALVAEYKALGYNDMDARIASIFLDHLANAQRELDALGAGRKVKLRSYDTKKINNADIIFSEGEGDEVLSALDNFMMHNNISKEDYPLYERIRGKKEEDLLAISDNQKMSNADKKRLMSMEKQKDNANRCFFLQSDWSKFKLKMRGEKICTKEQIRELQTKFFNGEVLEDVEKDRLLALVDYFFGSPEYKDTEGRLIPETLSYLDKQRLGSTDISSMFRLDKSFYVEDAFAPDIPIRESYRADFSARFSPENVFDWLSAEAKRMGSCYAVLKNFGTEPRYMLEDSIELYNRVINSSSFKSKYSKDALNKYMLISTGTADKLRTLLQLEMGLDNVTTTGNGVLLARSLGSVATAGLLAKAGANSITDLAYGLSHLVHDSFMNHLDIKEWGSIVVDMAKTFLNKDIREQVLVSAALAHDTMKSKILHTDFNSAEFVCRTGKTPKNNKYDPLHKKLATHLSSAAEKIYKAAGIDWFTNMHRAELTTATMRAIGYKKGVKYANMTSGEIAMLKRHGVSGIEWDEIFQKYCFGTMDDHQVRKGFDKVGMDGVYFYPEYIADISDKDMLAFMKKHNIYGAKQTEPNTELINSYRNDLLMKASLMLHASVRSEVTLPRQRQLLALNFGTKPGTGAGESMRQITKFQSFGMTQLQNHWGKVLANHVDMNNPLCKNIILEAFGNDPLGTTKDVFLSFAWLGLYTTMVKEALAFLAPKRKELLDADQFAGINWEDNATDFFRYSMESLGTASLLVDVLFSTLETGSVSFSAAPGVSKVTRDFFKVKRALTSDSTKGQRAKALGATAVSMGVSYTGLDRHPFTQALYYRMLGEALERAALGDDAYYKKQSRQERGGYIDSPTTEFLDWISGK